MHFLLMAMAVVAALMGLISGCTAGEQSDGTATPTPQTPDAAPTPPTSAEPGSPTPDAGPTPMPTPLNEAGRTEHIVVVDADGRVVVLDSSSGDEVRELLDGVRVDDPASNDVVMSPDGADVFVVVPPEEPGGDSEIVRLSVEGAGTEIIAQGTVPAVSPDGDTLAYVRHENPEDGAAPGTLPAPVVVLRDLDSGEERRLVREEPFHSIPDIEWTADGRQVVFTAGEISTGLYAVHPDAASLDAARRLGPDLGQEPDETSWGPIAALGNGELAVVETCCGPPREERWTVITVEVADGATDGTPLFADQVEGTHLDSDADAEGLLIVVRGGPEGGQLLRWDGDGDADQIAGGVIAAAW